MKKTNFTHFPTQFKWNALWLFCLFFGFTGMLTQVSAQCVLSCTSYTQVSLDEECEALITPDMILTTETSCVPAQFSVEISYQNVPIPTSPTVTEEWIGYTLTAKVTDN